MYTYDRFSSVLEKVDLSLLEYRLLTSSGPNFKIVHEWHAPGTDCLAGETVAAVILTRRGREFYVPLSLAPRLVFDCLAKYARFPLNASEIAARFQADDFYKQHGSNIGTGGRLRRHVARSAVRVHVERIRRALTLAFREANLRLDPRNVLASEEAGYRLRASVRVLHVDAPRHAR